MTTLPLCKNRQISGIMSILPRASTLFPLRSYQPPTPHWIHLPPLKIHPYPPDLHILHWTKQRSTKLDVASSKGPRFRSNDIASSASRCASSLQDYTRPTCVLTSRSGLVKSFTPPPATHRRSQGRPCADRCSIAQPPPPSPINKEAHASSASCLATTLCIHSRTDPLVVSFSTAT